MRPIAPGNISFVSSGTPEADAAAADFRARYGDAPLEKASVVVALGAYGWDAALRALAAAGYAVPRPRPRFGHGARVTLGPATLLGCYHPSQHNTFTGRLTPAMLDEVFATARDLAGISAASSSL